jgi:hypothetical protein
MKINLMNIVVIGVMAVVFILGFKMLAGATVVGKIPGVKTVADIL